MEGSQEKDYSFLGNDALVYERKLKRECLERQIYERGLLKSEPSIVKLIENKSDLILQLYSPSIVHYITIHST